MKAPTKQFLSKVEAFKRAINGATKYYNVAGNLVVEMLEENEDAFEILIAQTGVSLEMLEALERVGLGKLDPTLLANGSPLAWRAVKLALPMRDQKRLLETPIPVAQTNRKTGEVTKSLLPISKVPVGLVNQVLRENPDTGKPEIASYEDQAVIATERFQRAKEARERRYTVAGDKVTFHWKGPWDWVQLSEICDQIAPKAKSLQRDMQRHQISQYGDNAAVSIWK